MKKYLVVLLVVGFGLILWYGCQKTAPIGAENNEIVVEDVTEEVEVITPQNKDNGEGN